MWSSQALEVASQSNMEMLHLWSQSRPLATKDPSSIRVKISLPLAASLQAEWLRAV